MWLYDYYVWLYLNVVFMGPAKMIAKNDELEQFLKQCSLCGIK